MSYNILVSKRFEKEIKRLTKKFPSLKKEFSDLISTLKLKPETGISLGNNCFKIRLSIGSKGKGKSGGARVITYLYVQNETLYLLSIYDKSDKDTLTDKELKELLSSLNLPL